jgi:hypothetical protein
MGDGVAGAGRRGLACARAAFLGDGVADFLRLQPVDGHY